MHRIIPRSLWLAALALALSTTALSAWAPTTAQAQEEKVSNSDYNVEIVKPTGWEQSTGNEKAVAIFTDPKTQSQIEVVPTKLMTAEVSDVFFDTFHKTLTESNFNKDGETSQVKIGEVDGKLTVYKFAHSGVNLQIHVFSFVRESTAWLVVGYMQDTVQKDIEPIYKSTIEKMKFTKS
jgi:hypothetical protein